MFFLPSQQQTFVKKLMPLESRKRIVHRNQFVLIDEIFTIEPDNFFLLSF